ncbi:mitochondrial potassium channel ATP-binding subunit-like isoform X2 [Penaeus chinensis]|uniref:mitochondrial potassium channel ATP-binding subunit-like isoform X2 n=1 Tax=Penaeus chinensis TaxID=139456 RepID=UPI001FB6E394|nr:mitochondrial potassium channel ATP-binding subunit-like isoform X2 [Penaeus chinensis]
MSLLTWAARATRSPLCIRQGFPSWSAGNPGSHMRISQWKTVKLPKQLSKVVARSVHVARTETTSHTEKFSLTVLLRLGLGGGTLIGIKGLLTPVTADCKASPPTPAVVAEIHDRLHGAGQAEEDKDPPFDWLYFWHLLKPQLHYFLAAMGSALIVSLANIQIPLLLGEIVNVVARFTGEHTEEGNSYIKEITDPTLKIIKFYVAQAIFTFSYIAFLTRMGERMADDLRQQLFAALMKQDISFYDQHKTGELVNRLTADVQDFKSSFKMCISQGLRSVTQIIGCGVSLYSISPQMTGLTAVTVPVIIGIGTGLGSLLRALSREAQHQVARATGVADECLGNMRTVRAFAMEDSEETLYAREVDKSRQLNEDLGLGIGLFQYIKLQPSIPLKGGKIIPYHTLMGNIEFRNVSFAYPTRPDQEVLRNFSLRIPAGRVVALVGSSGGGKSTVAQLLERFYDVKEGSITIDGEDIRCLNPTWLRGRIIGFINQEPVLFATSVMENIRYGRPDATDEEVIEAAKTANAHAFIEAFPRGYNTRVGERGVTVSGGQKQRIAIARALLKNPTILVLDEATSALDAESEAVVQEALETCIQGRTVLIIAHRLSTIQNADVIAVMSHGKLAEIGTHEGLKKLGGIYADLIRQQQREEETPQKSWGFV